MSYYNQRTYFQLLSASRRVPPRGWRLLPSLDEKLRPFRQFNLDHVMKEGVLSSTGAGSSRGRRRPSRCT